jgi:hypothetical protein
MRLKALAAALFFCALLCGCSTVIVTPQGTPFPPESADNLQILKTPPTQSYTEIGLLNVGEWPVSKAPEMNAQMRTKAAKIGGQAVVVTSEGISRHDFTSWIWLSGSVIRWSNPD